MEIFSLDLVKIIEAVGYLGIFAIVFAESGLFFGVFLPGDSLLFTAGFLASQGFFDIKILSLLTFVAAVLGDNVGYVFGKKVGPLIFKREDSFWFHKRYLEEARRFYEKHGGKTIILARFLPIIRTFAPIVAGVGVMRYKTFFFYNVLGGFFWAIGVTATGFFLGSAIPNVDRYLFPIILLIILISLLPSAIHLLKGRNSSKE